MSRQSYLIAVLSGLLIFISTSGYPFLSAGAVPTDIILNNSRGNVTFTHAAHSAPGQYGSVACAACHHELTIADPTSMAKTPDAALAAIEKYSALVTPAPAGLANKNATDTAISASFLVMPCSACHGASQTPGFAAAHQEKYRAQSGEAACVTCHHTRFTGLTAGWNHESHQSYASNQCTTCHHPAVFEYKPGKTMEHKPQKCSNCHVSAPEPGSLTSTTLKDASHTRCESCHIPPLEEKMKGCPMCHVQKSTAEDLAKGSLPAERAAQFTACSQCHAPIPARMEAFHKNCKGCHDKTGKGPGSRAECETCHKPQKGGGGNG